MNRNKGKKRKDVAAAVNARRDAIVEYVRAHSNGATRRAIFRDCLAVKNDLDILREERRIVCIGRAQWAVWCVPERAAAIESEKGRQTGGNSVEQNLFKRPIPDDADDLGPRTRSERLSWDYAEKPFAHVVRPAASAPRLRVVGPTSVWGLAG